MLFQFTDNYLRKNRKCHDSNKTLRKKIEETVLDRHMNNDMTKFQSARLNGVARIEKKKNTHTYIQTYVEFRH